MLLEIEQKFPIADPPAIRRALLELGVTFDQPIDQTDVYFAHPCRNFKQTDEALRIRRVGQENFITYKGPKIDTETKTRREIELPLSPGEEGFAAFAELLEVLGFHRLLSVHKQRVPGRLVWEGVEITLALDEVAGLGSFLEMEQVAEPQELEAVKLRLAAVASRLNLQAVERRGYLEMLLAKKS